MAFSSAVSEITAQLVSAAALSFSSLSIADGQLHYLERRPAEKGRCVLIADGNEVTDPSRNVRTRVHEYGGDSYICHNGVTYFVNFSDQGLYKVDQDQNETPVVLEENRRYANFAITPDGKSLFAVCEDYTDINQILTYIVHIDTETNEWKAVAEGADFYAYPTVSPDGKKIAFISWDFPNMPWDPTRLHIADINSDGTFSNVETYFDDEPNSVLQPLWNPFAEGNDLYFMSDDAGYYDLYKVADGKVEVVAQSESEWAPPMWLIGTRSYAFGQVGDRTYVAIVENKGSLDFLNLLDLETGAIQEVDLPYTTITSICTDGESVYMLGSAPTIPGEISCYDCREGALTVLKKSGELPVSKSSISNPVSIDYPTSEGGWANMLFYPPSMSVGKINRKPPVIMRIHGGPTAWAYSGYSLGTQFWCSRGFAVADINYRGSTGFGRAFRDSLQGNWGVYDVDDCVYALKYLRENGMIDDEQAICTGGSAGGYTVMKLLCDNDEFMCGINLFGVTDIELLTEDTHKFESRYFDLLVGPYPEKKDLYIERSPLHHVEKITSPTLIFQGSEDKIVLPSQSRLIHEKLAESGIPVAYVEFEGEGHGFRRADSIEATLEKTLSFISQIMGFEPPEGRRELEIENIK
ncbi:MAG: hypothetical protein S4CHLAM102_03770 [Chlamydiia bacterium]|nr:hypothetical protein [Chlamydiia bacterium]